MIKVTTGIGALIIFSISLASCGGGGDSSPAPTPQPTAIPTAQPTAIPTAVPTSTTFTVSGTLEVASNIFRDTDNNDPYSEYSDNSSASTAQTLPNTAVLQGFVTKDSTGVEGDRFEFEIDEDDVYRVSLQAGQIIRVQVVDYDGFSTDSTFKGDIDLQLYDDQQNLISTSDSVTEFEELVVPQDGEYYVLVYAYSGTSKYILHIMNSLGSNNVASVNTGEFVPGQAVVIYKSQSNNRQKPSINKPSLLHFDAVLGNQKPTMLSKFDTELSLRNPASFEKRKTLENIKQLRQRENISAVSPNYLRYSLAVPNDEYFGLQWHYGAINLPAAWEITTGASVSSNDVLVAVVDTGVFLDHIELAGQLVAGYDFISALANSLDGDGIDNNPDDPGDSSILGQSSWHGTHVAGTIAMLTDNNVGAAGIAYGAKIMPLRALGAQGGSSYDIMQAVSYAAGLSNDSGTVPSRRADIVNMSLGGPGFSQAESEFYQSLYNQGVIIVAAAGNDNSSTLMFPASYGGVFSVSATDYAGNRAPYSNYGSQVDIAAPGGNTAADLNGDGYPDGVLSTLVDDSSGNRNSSLQFYQGTSMAAPHIAGVFALMKSVYPGLTPTTVDAMLQSGLLTTDMGSVGRDDVYGYGLIDAYKAVTAARDLEAGGTAPEPAAIVVATPAQVPLGLTSSATVELRNAGGGAPQVTAVDAVESWLDASPLTIDGNGLGSYTFSVSRDGLVQGTYIGTVIFKFDSAADLSVTVSMQVGDTVSEGGVAQLYAILVDPSSNDTSQTVFVEEVNNALTFSFSEVELGTYQLLVGTDIDNDQFICQTGEACGAYPTLNRIDSLIVDQDFTNLNFTIDLMSSIESLSANSVTDSSNMSTETRIQRKRTGKTKYIQLKR